MSTLQKILCQLGVLFGYAVLIGLVAGIHHDYICLLAWGCNIETMDAGSYVIPGNVLAFLNLWALVFFVNVDFFRNGPLTGRGLLWPVVSSTVWSVLVFISAFWITAAGMILVSAWFGVDIN